MDQHLVCILAGQRSGTTMLQSILGATGRIANFREILQWESLDQPGSFLGFCKENNVQLLDFARYYNLQSIVDKYFAHVRELASSMHVLVDIKFNAWTFVQPIWHYVHEEPFLLKYLKDADARFIFLQRENLAEQILSEHIARSADKWHNLSPTDIPDGSLTVGIGQVKRQAKLICQSEALFYEFLRTYRHAVFLQYESIYDDNGLSDRTKSVLCETLGEQLQFPERPRTLVNQIEKSKVVSNYSEVVEAVAEVVAEFPRPRFATEPRATKLAQRTPTS